MQAFGLEAEARSRVGWGFFLCFVWGFPSFLSLSGEIRTQISRKFDIPEKFDHRRIPNFSFVPRFLDPGSNSVPTGEHEGVQLGFGREPGRQE